MHRNILLKKHNILFFYNTQEDAIRAAELQLCQGIVVKAREGQEFTVMSAEKLECIVLFFPSSFTRFRGFWLNGTFCGINRTFNRFVKYVTGLLQGHRTMLLSVDAVTKN